jgi:hypothetical protein
MSVLMLLFAAPAMAQDDELQFEDEMFVIKGEVQKPEVVVVISRENLDKGFELELRESFLDKIVDALREAPF